MAHSSSSSSSADEFSSSSSSYIQNYSSSTSSGDNFAYDCMDANTYFGVQNHIKCYDWVNFTQAQRCASWNQSVRELELFLGRELTNPITGEYVNDFYAVCEQALFILEWTSHREGKDLTTSINLNDKVDNNFINSQAITVCVQAQRFLGLNRNTVQGY
jgi:hypothetical protein